MNGLRYRAMLIGNGRYEDRALPDLLGPENDVAALHDALTHREWGLFRRQDIIPLVNKPLKEVREQLRIFFDEAAHDDVLLVFFSGHGEPMADRLYFCLLDTMLDRLEETGLAAAEVSRFVHESPSQRVVILLDCCHSGAYKAGVKPIELVGKGRLVLASTHGRGTSPSALDAESLSPFSEHVQAALSGGATDTTGRVTFETLARYVSDRVPESRKFVEQGQGELDLAQPGGLAAIGRSWSDAFDDDARQPGQRPVQWPQPPTPAQAKTILATWARGRSWIPSDLIREVYEVRAASVAGISCSIVVDRWQESKEEWTAAKANQLPEYRGPIRSHDPAHLPVGETWQGAQLGSKTKRHCSGCGGSGDRPCPNPKCDSGHISCPKQQPCPHCARHDETNRYRRRAPNSVTQHTTDRHAEIQPRCPRCDGTHRVACDRCNGRGSRPCPICDETGRVGCEKCEGGGTTIRFTRGTLTRHRRQFRAIAAEDGAGAGFPLRGLEKSSLRQVVGRLDEVGLWALPKPLRKLLDKHIRHELSRSDETFRSMDATVDILPAAQVTFYDGHKTRTALLIGERWHVRLDAPQRISIVAHHAGSLIYRAATGPSQRTLIVLGVGLLLLTTAIALLIASN